MSAASDKHEHDVAKNIDATIKGLKAVRPKVASSYPDVMVEYKSFKGSSAVWVEVKMNHTDNLLNTRFIYTNGKWDLTPAYESAANRLLCAMWNKNKEAKQWIEDLKVFLVKNKWKGDIKKLSLHSGKKERAADPNSVSLELMKKFLKTRPTKNICKEASVDVGNLVSLHYLKGKSAVAYYLSSGDDFYYFKTSGGKTNPLKIPDVELFSGTNSIVLRVGDRSDNFELQSEVKLRSLPSTNYSVKPGSKKPNPFRFIQD